MSSKIKTQDTKERQPRKRKRLSLENEEPRGDPSKNSKSTCSYGDEETEAGPSEKKKSLGYSGDGPAEPGHAEPSTSRNAVESSDGGGEPAVRRIPKHTAREMFFQQYRNMQIEVNSSVHISRVWYFKRGVPAENPLKSYDVLSRDYPLEQHQRWNDLPSFACPDLFSDNEETFNIIYKIFDEMSLCLIWNGSKWICDKAKEEEYDDFIDQLLSDDQYFILPLAFTQCGSLFEALKGGMTNGIGRDGIRSVLQLALLPRIGNLWKNSVILNVGTSRAKEERFPVDIVPHNREIGMVDYFLRSSDSNCSGELEIGSHDPGSDICKGEIYTDILLLTIKEKWACCIFVVEIKSEPLNERHVGQLFCQMLALLLHQRFCFGLLINAREAFLYSMEWNKVETKIYYSRKFYNFLDDQYLDGTRVTQFNADTMKHLFNDIVAFLQYSKNNLTKCMQKY